MSHPGEELSERLFTGIGKIDGKSCAGKGSTNHKAIFLNMFNLKCLLVINSWVYDFEA